MIFRSSLFLATLTFGLPLSAAETSVRFNKDVRPILSDTCFHCHGPDKSSRKAGLRLDLREEALKPAKSGAIPIVPGNIEESEVVRRLFTTDGDELMPPVEAHKTLSKQQKETLRDWIAQGANYEPHWAYTPLSLPAVPEVHDKQWLRQPIDNFILHRLESLNLKPSAQADKATLLRRLSLDLIGLPPSTTETATFLADNTPGAWEKQVDRLLANPHFGERWAVWWLDVARFSDTVGFHGDQNMRNFPYRDYVINAFNINKPMDLFTMEQLAGDLMPNPTPETLTASGFNRLNMVTREGGAQAKEYLAKYGAERVRTVATTFLGSTFGCAECHDHKFDPISAKDFYSLQSFFADIKQWGVYSPYSSSPNDELKGYNNESPFPPEMEVDSDFLARKAQKLKGKIGELVAANRLPEKEKAWRESLEAFLKTNPDGWISPKPEVASNAPKLKKPKAKAAETPVASQAPTPVPEAEESPFSVSDKRVVEFHGKAQDDTTLTLTPPAGRYAALKLELIPSAQHKGSILRNGVQGADTINLSAKILPITGKPAKAVPFHFATADKAAPRWANGGDVLGVQDGWLTVAKKWNEPHTAIYQASVPMEIGEGETLVVTMAENSSASFRVSLSPIAFASPNQNVSELLTEEKLPETFLTSTNSVPSALAQHHALWRQIAACHEGRAQTLISQPVPTPLTVKVLHRGNWMDETGEVVEPQSPHFLPQIPNPENRRLTRLDLAKWLCSNDNPLTPRTFANRLWKQFFGNALSIATDDLGAQGESPSHPELLDWISMQFTETKWDFKKIVRQMVTSATYQQGSSLRPELKDLDPNNRLLASQNPRRLEAEFVRDNALAIAGMLNEDFGGPSIKPYQPGGYYANLQFPDRNYVAEADEGQYRRGVYMHWQRTFLHPMLANFDAPNRDECIAARGLSNTPQQALTLLNDPSFTEAAKGFAEVTTPKDFAAVFQRALARNPKPAEVDSLGKFYETQLAWFKANPLEAEKLLKVGLKASKAVSPEAAAWTATCRVVLNLHETITRY